MSLSSVLRTRLSCRPRVTEDSHGKEIYLKIGESCHTQITPTSRLYLDDTFVTNETQVDVYDQLKKNRLRNGNPHISRCQQLVISYEDTRALCAHRVGIKWNIRQDREGRALEYYLLPSSQSRDSRRCNRFVSRPNRDSSAITMPIEDVLGANAFRFRGKKKRRDGYI